MKHATTANNFGTPETAKTVTMDSFFILDKQNEGRKLFLATPDGKITDMYLIVRGRYTDEVSVAIDLYNRERLQNAAKPESDRIPNSELIAVCRASMIAGWNLPEELTKESAVKLLRNAPQIGVAVDQFSWDERNFF